MKFHSWAVRCFLLLSAFCHGSAAAGGMSELFLASNVRLILSLGTLFMGELGDRAADAASEVGDSEGPSSEGTAHANNGKFRRRNRNYVHDIMDQHGPYYARRAYRMSVASFWRLHALLHPLLVPRPTGPRSQRRGAKNGVISTPIRLSAALRYFAGGRPEDISISHGISHSEIFTSVWRVVDAINNCESLQISYPESHEKQREIARGFKKKSKAGFANCAGAIDCMLAWIEKPTKRSCDVAKCGEKRFYCGRKHKYGICMQAICDSDGRFLDVSLGHPASTSDFMAFTSSGMGRKLEDESFLAPELTLFGDCAYVNCRYMTTPFQRVGSGPKDDFNFYHSQVRIKIECAFGMLVNRWGLLRRAIPASITLDKTMCLIMALCKLHNFCINERIRMDGQRGNLSSDLAPSLPEDSIEVMGHGGFAMIGDSVDPPRQGPAELVGAGHHHDDSTPAIRQSYVRAHTRRDQPLPRETLLSIVVSKGLKRPKPRAWKDLLPSA